MSVHVVVSLLVCNEEEKQMAPVWISTGYRNRRSEEGEVQEEDQPQGVLP